MAERVSHAAPHVVYLCTGYTVNFCLFSCVILCDIYIYIIYILSRVFQKSHFQIALYILHIDITHRRLEGSVRGNDPDIRVHWVSVCPGWGNHADIMTHWMSSDWRVLLEAMIPTSGYTGCLCAPDGVTMQTS